MPIYDVNNTIITKGVALALSRPDVIEIENRTLDGLRHIQTIGSGGTLLDVIAHFTMAEKIVFDQVKRLTSVIKVTFDGRYYTGYISGEPSYERLYSTKIIMFTISFVLAVQEEGAI